MRNMTYGKPFTITGYTRSGAQWYRFDYGNYNGASHERYFCAGPADKSGHHDERRDYQAKCSLCWLGFGHTEEAHAERLAAHVQDLKEDPPNDIVRRSYTGNL